MNRGKTFILVFITLLFAGLFIYRYAVEPLYSEDQKTSEVGWATGKLNTQRGIYDVIVVGEQPDGIAAAVTAARAGAKTLLLVENKCLFEADGIDAKRTLGIEPIGGKTPGRILNELDRRLGKEFTTTIYKQELGKLVGKEKNLNIVYNASVTGVLLEQKRITGLKVFVNTEIENYKCKRVIDSTIDGKVLSLCSIPAVDEEEYRPDTVKHYKGDYVLTEDDIVTGTLFYDSVVTGSEKNIVQTPDTRDKIPVFKNVQYSIPLRCMLPQEIENLLMTGPKASYTGLAAISTCKMWIMVISGEAAGNTAVFSLIENITPRRLATGNLENLNDLQKILKRQGILVG